ncbi:MAG: hypothetical protein Q9218_002669 [Villophora microphyllina]
MALRMPLLLRPHRLAPLALGLSFAIPAYVLHARRHPILCEASSPLDTITQKYLHTDTSGRKVEVKKEAGTARIIRQLSLGSVLGVVGGVAVSMFSRMLGGLFGLGLVVVQYAASKGYNIIPVGRIQRYVKGVNLRRAVEENPAFKLSLGTTFVLASMASF